MIGFACNPLSDNEVEITGYELDEPAVNIPETLDGKKVVKIADFAFVNCANITSVKIPPSVTSIGIKAFAGCKSLADITISHTAAEIGRNAFFECASLTAVTLPDNVTNCLGAFGGCKNIKVAFKGKTYDYKHIEKLYKAINNY